MTLKLLTLAAISLGLLTGPTIGMADRVDPVAERGIEIVDLVDRLQASIVTDESDVDWSRFAPVPPPIVPGGGGVSYRL